MMDHARGSNVTVGMPDASKNAQMLREQAERCRRLARATIDMKVCRTLLELAAEFEQRAAAEETQPCDR